jgi:hypothetical protein
VVLSSDAVVTHLAIANTGFSYRGRPSCTRCVSARFKCDGYSHKQPDRSTKRPTRARALLPNHHVRLTLARVPQTSIFDDESEYRYFEFFLMQPTSCLQGYFDTSCIEVWNFAGRLLLQACYREEFVRSGIVAIAALNKTMATASLSSAIGLDTGFRSLEEKQHRHFALLQYSKALRLMRHISATTVDDYRLRNILLACLITTCVECYQGNHQEALNHAMTGIKLLSSYQKRRLANCSNLAQSFPKAQNSVIDTDLITTYSRLEQLIWKVTSRSHFKNSEAAKTQMPQDSIPTEFLSLGQARLHWNLNCRRAMIWGSLRPLEPAQESTSTTRSTSLPRQDTPCGTSLVINTELENTIGDMIDDPTAHTKKNSRWAYAFNPLFLKCRSKPKTSSDFQGATILMIKHLSVSFLYPSSEDDEQQSIDAEKVTNMARELLESENLYRDQTERADNIRNFDGSVVAALFLVATRCRHRGIRREAMKLLREHPRREGLWDSVAVANVVQLFVDEEDVGPCWEEYVPLNSRRVIVRNEIFLSEHKALVQCDKQKYTRPKRRELLPPKVVVW